MALYRFRNLDRYGRYRTKIFHHPDGEDFKYPKKGLGPFVAVSKFKYEYRG